MARKQKPTVPVEPEETLDTSSLFADIKESDVEIPEIPPAKPVEISQAKSKRGRPRKYPESAPYVPPAPEEAIVCGSDEANALLDLLQPITAWAAQKIYNVSASVASQAFVFGPSQRDKINPPLIRVMNKWLPSMVRKWQDELGLAVVLGSAINAQITMMKIYDVAEKRAKAPSPVNKENANESPTSQANAAD